jgi:phage-related protein (TIGR01555 family)
MLASWFQRFDAWINVMTGLGSATRDKATAFVPTLELPLDTTTLDALFANNALARRIVSTIPDDALREGFDFTSAASDLDPKLVQEQSEELVAECQRLGVLDKFGEAMTWGRLYGFGGVIMGVDDSGAPETPLEDEAAGALSWMMVVDKREMVPQSYYSDPASDKFGDVEFYRVEPSSIAATAKTFGSLGKLVHESRVIRFGGVRTSRIERQRNQGCDTSVLQPVYNSLQKAEQNWASVCQLMTDMSQGVFTVEGLMDMLASGNESLLQKRVQAMDMGRSVARSIILDAGREKFERVATPMGGVNEVLEQSWKRVAADAELPLTVLMGVSPAGLNATGESDVRLYYDKVGRARMLYLTPPLLRVARFISRSLGHTRPDAWQVVWPSLWQMTAGEEADYRLKTTQADDVEIKNGTVLPEEVALTRYGGKKYNGGKLQISVDERKVSLKAALKDITDPPPPPKPQMLPPNGAPPQRALPPAAGNGADDAAPPRADAFNDSDHPRDKDGKFTEGGGGSGGGSAKEATGGGSASDRPVTSYPKRELNPETPTTKPMPQHPLGAAANSPEVMADYHRQAAEHFASRGEHGIAQGHAIISAKYEKRAKKERTH